VTTVTLVYPYFQPSNDNSIFRFPPLGLGYIAAYLEMHGISVDLVDCTFMSEEQALEKIKRSKPRIIGIQAVFSIKEKAIQMARLLREHCGTLVAGGPLPTTNPQDFLEDFDIVVMGEGEKTMLEIALADVDRKDFSKIKGVAVADKGKLVLGSPRDFVEDLDSIPFPSRQFYDNQAYKNYYSRKFGYTISSVMTSRGCPFKCDFCSRPIFGNEFRSRSATNVVDEVEEVRALGYSRIWFADDCFTLNRRRLSDICDELVRRRVRIGWECLSRVDTVDSEVAEKMKRAGCERVFFGIESGNDDVLAIMKKQVTTKQAERAVHTFKKAAIQVGAFFIVGYPGENDETVLDTVKFASSLPLDYLSFTMPYPIPGTSLYAKVKDNLILDDWQEPKKLHLVGHRLLFNSPFSEAKLKFAIIKGMSQFYIRRYLGNRGHRLVGTPYECLTDALYRLMP
jgi:anaerobic magnesium-protoporphyrin IX monomethyl ester cyclase